MQTQDQFSSPAKEQFFHKNIDLGGKPLLIPSDNANLNTTAANSLVRVPSLTSVSSTYRGSFLSSTLVSPSRFRSSERSNNNYVPQVNIAELIKKKAHLYHDETLTVNFDDVLETGYNMVLKKKHQKTLLKDNEEALRAEINSLEKEILPELNKLFANKEKVKYLRSMKAKYDKEIEEANQQNLEMKQAITERKREVEGLGTNLVKRIKELDSLTTTLKHDYANNKILHKQQLYEMNQTIKKNQAAHQKQLEELEKIKGEYEKLYGSKGERKRKMENKAKMYLGILKH